MIYRFVICTSSIHCIQSYLVIEELMLWINSCIGMLFLKSWVLTFCAFCANLYLFLVQMRFLPVDHQYSDGEEICTQLQSLYSIMRRTVYLHQSTWRVQIFVVYRRLSHSLGRQSGGSKNFVSETKTNNWNVKLTCEISFCWNKLSRYYKQGFAV